jgi:hypothetical protein
MLPVTRDNGPALVDFNLRRNRTQIRQQQQQSHALNNAAWLQDGYWPMMALHLLISEADRSILGRILPRTTVQSCFEWMRDGPLSVGKNESILMFWPETLRSKLASDEVVRVADCVCAPSSRSECAQIDHNTFIFVIRYPITPIVLR